MKNILFLSLLSVGILAGCASEPSDTDISTGMKKYVDENNSALKGPAALVDSVVGKNGVTEAFVEMAKTDFVSAKKVSCSADKSSENMWTCRLSLSTSNKMSGTSSEIVDVLFARTAAGFVVASEPVEVKK